MIINEKYHWVNALRGYAILMVMLIHTSQVFKVSYFTKLICDRGDLGVQLFFILSSFTLFNSYSKRRLREGVFVNRNFFIRRFFRIAPYYYIAGLVYIFYKLFVKNHSISVKNLIANFTFTNGIYLPGINDIPPGGWSIGVEMLFYLLIPILFKYLDSLEKAIFAFVVLVILSVLINHYYLNCTTFFLDSIWDVYNEWSLYFWLPNQLPVFILGIILYHIYLNVVFTFKSGQIMVIVSMALFIILSFFKFSIEYPYYFIKREYVYGLIFVLFAIGVYTTENKFLINRLIQKIGIVSFSMYLNHFLIITTISYFYNGGVKVWVEYLDLPKIILQNDFVFVCLYLLIVFVTYIISKYSYKYIEVKGIEFGDKWISKLKNKGYSFN
jgi:peptidoglycan/LPS O-acetylase OafA/YrhL